MYKGMTAEKALDVLFGLPEHPSDSEAEGDEDDTDLSETSFVAEPNEAITVKMMTESPDTAVTSIQTRKRKKSEEKNQRKSVEKLTVKIRKPTTRNITTSVNEQIDANFSILNECVSDEDDQTVSDIDTGSANDNWSNTISSNFTCFPDFQISLTPMATHNFPDNALPGDFFARFFDQSLCEMLVMETNKYASQKPVKNWHGVTMEELKAFMGVLILMGIHQLPSIDSYWSSVPILRVDPVNDVMTCKRFKKILEALHCNDNTTAAKRGEDGHDRLHKVRPVITDLNIKFKKEYKHSARQSIDESMIRFKGRSFLKQYMPMKPIKRGYKVWARADPLTGYLSEFEIYTGKETNTEDMEMVDPLGSRVVKKLCHSIDPDEYSTPILVVFNNFFTSFDLMQFLFEKGIYAVATVRSNRKDLLQELKLKNKMEKGKHTFSLKHNVCGIQWKDTKHVNLLTTAHNPEDVVEVRRTQKDSTKLLIACPKAIKDYTTFMRGVDRFDQLKEYYTVSRRSKKYWLRMFYYLMDAALVNSYILHKLVKSSLDTSLQTHLQFNLNVARYLISGFSSRRKPGSQGAFYMQKNYSSDGKLIGVPSEVRFHNVGDHLPVELPSFRRCRLCSTAAHDKRSKIMCSACLVPLCTVPCFKQFHTK